MGQTNVGSTTSVLSDTTEYLKNDSFSQILTYLLLCTHTHTQCDEITGKVTNNVCPTPPPIYVDTTSIGLKILLRFLEFVGLHGIVGFFGGTLLCCGCVRLIFGGVIFCRKSKAQEHHDELRKKGAQRAQGSRCVCVSNTLETPPYM